MYFLYLREKHHCENRLSENLVELSDGWSMFFDISPQNNFAIHSITDESVCGLIGHVSNAPHNDAIEIAKKAFENGIKVEDELSGHYTFFSFSRKEAKAHLERTFHSSSDIYHSVTDKMMIFADSLYEIKSLVDISCNEDVLPEYLLYREVLGPRTLVEGFRKLMPRESIDVKCGSVTARNISKFPNVEKNMTKEFFVTGVEECMKSFFESDIRHSRRVTNSLSGGEDSSLTQFLAMSCQGYEVNDVFSVSLNIPGFPERNEDDYALTAAKSFNVVPNLVEVIERDVPACVLTAIKVSGYPLPHFQSAWFIKLAKEISLSYRYCYVSEGADSLFGNEMMKILYRVNWLDKMKCNWITKKCEKFDGRERRVLKSLFPSLSDYCDNQSVSSIYNQSGYITDYEHVKSKYGSDVIQEIWDERRDVISEYLPAICQPATQYSIAKMLGSVAPTIPKWAAIAKSQGVAFLFPFADSRLVDFVVGSPENLRLDLKIEKPTVKKLLMKHRKFLTRRPKKSFGVPLERFCALPEIIDLAGLANKKSKVDENFTQGGTGNSHGNIQYQWAKLGLAIWKENFC